jgi:tetratricopeptide (TPR) repeat protein
MGDKLDKKAVLEAARQYLEAGRIDKAIHEFQRVAAANPEDLRLQLRIAELHVKMKEVAQATTIYGEVARKYVDEGFYLKAVTVYKTMIKINPALREVNLALGELYEKMGLEQDAIHQYQILLRYYEQHKESDKALDLRRRIVALDPEGVTNRVRLAEAYQLHGKEDASLHEYEVLAEQLKDVGPPERLMDLYEKILAKKPTHVDFLKRLTRLLVAGNDGRTALQWMTTCESIVKEDPELLRQQAELLALQNQLESSRTTWEALAELWVSRGEEDEALLAYQEIFVSSPEEVEGLREDVERVRPGAFAHLQTRGEAIRIERESQAEAEASREEAQTKAQTKIQAEEEKARERASRKAPKAEAPRATDPEFKPLVGEEIEGARHRAEASVQLGDAYKQMGLEVEAKTEYAKALTWYRRLLAAQAGDQPMADEIKRLEGLVNR